MRRAEPLSRHTSMRVGGPADLFCEVESESALAALVRASRAARLPTFLLGGGTNLVVADRGVRGVTIKLARSFARTEWLAEDDQGAQLVAGAAANFKRLVLEVTDRGFTGLEFGEGIPGTVGGGVLMNAGAFGGEIANVVVALRGVSAAGELVRIPRGRAAFAYRRLDLPAGLVVTALELRVERGDAGGDRARGRGGEAQARPPSAARAAQCRLDLQESSRRLRGPADRAVRAQGPRGRGRAGVAAARQLHRQHRRRPRVRGA